MERRSPPREGARREGLGWAAGRRAKWAAAGGRRPCPRGPMRRGAAGWASVGRARQGGALRVGEGRRPGAVQGEPRRGRPGWRDGTGGARPGALEPGGEGPGPEAREGGAGTKEGSAAGRTAGGGLRRDPRPAPGRLPGPAGPCGAAAAAPARSGVRWRRRPPPARAAAVAPAPSPPAGPRAPPRPAPPRGPAPTGPARRLAKVTAGPRGTPDRDPHGTPARARGGGGRQDPGPPPCHVATCARPPSGWERGAASRGNPEWGPGARLGRSRVQLGVGGFGRNADKGGAEWGP